MMKKHLIILILTIPLIGIGQNTESKDDKNMFHVSEVLFYDPNMMDSLTVLKVDSSVLNGIVYSEYGQIGSFLDGRRYGLHRNWDENGKLTYECEFIDGKRNGIQKIYTDGQIRFYTEYEDDKMNGVSKSWLRGNLFSEENYKNDVLDGFYKIYETRESDYSVHKIGDLKLICDYKNGEKNGVLTTFLGGKVYKIQLYRDGEKIDEHKVK
jgi:antitoxin component YwqK of YwqJK toxin-antitoxin module